MRADRNLAAIRKIVAAGPVDKRDKQELHNDLAAIIAECGKLWDMIDGTDSFAGPPRKYGTRNRKSMTYKCRKVARYSYP